ncbi:MAG TPA: MarC family protein [Candidatus Baltobacteraceae bacterium]|nr:MarC family protein [Candidatus Baltobacteraceae bacterium]
MLLPAAIFKTFFATFGVMDPVGNVPTFLSLTEKLEPKARHALAAKAVLCAGGILLVFTFLGNAILDAFHVSIESFRIAGGLVLILLGLEILFGFSLRSSKDDAQETDISVVPLATPLIAGPGMVTTAVILAKEYGYAATLAGIAVNLVLSWLLFRYAGLVRRLLGTRGTAVFAKMMGLILIAMGVEFVRIGMGAA